jgi:hypothetical protein
MEKEMYHIALWQTDHAGAEVADAWKDQEIDRFCPMARQWANGDPILSAIYCSMYFAGIHAIYAAAVSVDRGIEQDDYWRYQVQLPEQGQLWLNRKRERAKWVMNGQPSC